MKSLVVRSPVKASRLTSSPAPRQVRPLLKWAGGKGQLLAQFACHYPPKLKQGAIKRIIEPFVGSGAVFLHLLQNYSVSEVVLNDTNPEIMRLYRVLQIAPGTLIDCLLALQSHYLALDEAARQAFYYEIRDSYNQQGCAIGDAVGAGNSLDLVTEKLPESWIQRAAWTVFLNKTCFNGLFRVNGKGAFNVPFGRYNRPAICDPENVMAVARLLQRARLLCGDYPHIEPWVDEDTLVYFDPPYRPLTRTAAFTAYAPGGFGESDQKRLGYFFRRLDRQTGASLMLSNSDPANVDPTDDFFESLYKGFTIRRVEAGRMINANAARRGKITELLIINY